VFGENIVNERTYMVNDTKTSLGFFQIEREREHIFNEVQRFLRRSNVFII